MTEMNGILGQGLWMPKPRRARYLVDPVAFSVALIGGPLFVTAVSFWLLFIPVLALIIGGPFYVLVGGPMVLAHLHRHRGSQSSIIWLACRTIIIVSILGMLACVLAGHPDAVYAIILLSFPAMIFGFLWAWAFGWIYFNLRRAFYARPLYKHL